MATLCLQEEETISEKVKGFPLLYNKRVKGFKQKKCCSKRLGIKYPKV